MQALLWHLMEGWNDLVRSQRDPAVPTSTNRLEGWFGRFKPRARLTRGLKTEAGTLNFVQGWPTAWPEPTHGTPLAGRLPMTARHQCQRD